MTTRLYALATAILVALTPFAVAGDGPLFDPGLPRACEVSGNKNPCRDGGDNDGDDDEKVIPNTHVPPGEEKVYTGEWTAVGTVVVEGTVKLVDATVTFEPTSTGFVVQGNGTLHVLTSSLVEANGSDYGIVAGPETTLQVNDSSIVGGSGVKVHGATLSLFENTLQDIPLALHLVDVSATVHHNTFRDNTIAVNQTGGTPTLESNVFDGGEICVKDWRTNPAILNNTFARCHVGIYHQESHSLFLGNFMEDQAEPPGAGMWIVDGLSPVIEENVIRNYGTGIRIVGARAFVRNNTIEGNVGAGVLVEQNAGPMDIQGNLIRGNGGDGIRLVNALDVPVFNNVIEGNGGDGIRMMASTDTPLTGNVVRDNGGDGIVVQDSALATLSGNAASGHPGVGIALRNAPDATLTANLAEANAMGIVVDGTSLRATLTDNDATGNVGDGMLVTAAGASILRGSANANGGSGLVLKGALQTSLVGLTANGNGLDGVFIGGSEANVEEVNASENARNGFTYDPMGPLDLLAPTPMVLVRALHNGGAGLHNIEGNATSVRDGWWEGNGVGVKNSDVLSLIDARECYWGSATGPTHALNPGGTGDSVEGGVLYTPFRTEPPGHDAAASIL